MATLGDVTRLVALLIVVAGLAGACATAGAPAPAAGADPVLFDGQAIWESQCASCHRADGSGGRGPRLDGDRVFNRFDSVDAQVEFLSVGRGAMPGFEGRLDDDQLEAVARYTREVLAGTR